MPVTYVWTPTEAGIRSALVQNSPQPRHHPHPHAEIIQNVVVFVPFSGGLPLHNCTAELLILFKICHWHTHILQVMTLCGALFARHIARALPSVSFFHPKQFKLKKETGFQSGKPGVGKILNFAQCSFNRCQIIGTVIVAFGQHTTLLTIVCCYGKLPFERIQMIAR